MKKNILLLAAALLFSAASTFAQGGTTGPLTWNLDNGTLTISGEGAMPDYIYGTAPWYVYQASIHTIVIETGVTTIGRCAFISCRSLLSISIPHGVTTIGERAFTDCLSLISITIPNSVTNIEEAVFLSCENLSSITIPNSVTYIGNSAFYDCNKLTSITLSNNIASIEGGTFMWCESLASITIPDGVTTIGNSAFCYCFGLTSVTIPNSVTKIESHAFYYCTSLSSVTIPKGITNIEKYTFSTCTSLSSVTIPNSVTRIEDYAFSDCESLASIIIPNSVTMIGTCAFMYCTNLTSVILSNSLLNIGDYAFCCSGLNSITIPNSVMKIGNSAFWYCTSLLSINVENENYNFFSEDGVLFNNNKSALICYPAGKTISTYIVPRSVTSIKEHAFSFSTNLTAIDVETENNYYVSEDGVLFNKSKTILVCCPGGKTGAFVVPDNVITIGSSAFLGCTSLTLIIIPNSVTSIGNEAFRECTNLISIIIPNSVKKIGTYVAYNCTSLTSITNLNPVPIKISSSIFFNMPQSACTLTVPTSAVSAYQNANVWNEFNIVGGGILVNPVANNSKYGYTTGDGLYQEGEMATVTATAYENCKFINWTKDGVEVSRENTYIFFVTEDVELVAVFEEIVGIVETDNYPSLRVYPNPTEGVLHVETLLLRQAQQPIASLQNGTLSAVEVFDVMGRMVYTVETRFIASLQDGTTTLDISGLPAGIYFVRIQTDKGTVTRKVVKI